jgi:hypothetical protein
MSSERANNLDPACVRRTIMPRTLVAALVASALAGAGVGVSRAGDLKKCSIAVKGDSPVKSACEEGGVDQAKSTMKRMLGVARSKQRGRHWACDDCHVDEDTWKLGDDARKRFKELLLVLGDDAR